MEATYKVDGMTCGGCARSVTNAVTAAAPGATVEVDLADKSVRVQGEHDPKHVEQAVEDAGFDFGGAKG